jgi:predicted MFS family arabinose efflux permease
MPRPRLPLVVILLAQFVIPLSISGTAIALPGIAADLGDAPGPLQWVVNGFNVSFAVCTVVWGVLSDRIGYTLSFRLGLTVALAGNLLSLIAPGLGMLDAARAVTGVGAAAVLTGCAPLLNRLYAGPARAAAFALFGTVNGLGLAAGPALSGLLLTLLNWKGIFAAHAVLLLLALAGTIWLPLVRGVGAVSVRTLLDFSALRRPRFLAMTLVPVAGAIGFVTYLTYLPGAFGAVHGLDSGRVGWLMLVMTVPVLLAPALVGRVARSPRIRRDAVVLASLGCLLLGGIGVSVTLRPDVPVAVALAPMVLLGLGFGLPLGFVDAEALAAVPADKSGAASGVLNLLRIGSEAVFVALFAAILSAVVTAVLPADAGRAVAAGAAGHPWEYYRGLVPASLARVVLIAVIGVAFWVLERVQARVALITARGAR